MKIHSNQLVSLLVKGGCVVTGRGVVLTLTTIEEDRGTSVDVAVAGDKVEQRVIEFPNIFRSFGAFWQLKISQECLPRNLSQDKVKLN